MINLNFGHIPTGNSQEPRGAIGKDRLPAVLSRSKEHLRSFFHCLNG